MATYPGGSNTFIPNWDASNKMMIEFSRNPKSFAINRYCGMKTVKKELGYYLEATAEEGARVVSEDDYDWADGQDAPEPNEYLESFGWKAYRCHRKAYPFAIGYLASQQADFNVIALHGRVQAMKAMTARSLTGITKLVGGSWGSNTDTATNLGGGLWSASSATNQYILKTFMEVQIRIDKATNGVIQPGMLRCVINPNMAKTIRTNPEILDFIKQQGSAGEMIKGTAFFMKWGIPEYLYGVKMEVDNTVRITSRKGATVVKDYVLANTVAVFVTLTEDVDQSVPRTAEAGDALPTFDTLTCFLMEDMTVEEKDDPDNRKTKARIVDHYGFELTAPSTGFYVTGAAS